MRTTHISPEYTYSDVNGTLSMIEKKSFMCSKLLKFDDAIYIKNQNIIYYQSAENEQLNFNNEKLIQPLVYNTDNDKQTNSSLIIGPSQNEKLNNNASWVLTINYGKILMNYLFATLKKYRTFEGITNNITMNNDVDSAIKNYISSNILSRYEFYKTDLYIGYNDIKNGGLRFNNNWDQKVGIDSNLVTRIQTKTDSTNKTIAITFNQEKPSSDYSFNYYYNLYFTKI